MILSLMLFVIGLGLVIAFAEQLVKGALSTSLSLGVSPFLVSVLFIGFDPENLAVGAVEGVAGIALGSIIGAAMVAIALAFGVTALCIPMAFGQAPKRVLAVPIVAGLLLELLCLDGQLSRGDGAVLLLGFVLAIVYLVRLSKRGLDISPRGESVEILKETEASGKWRAVGLFVLSLVAIIVGSEMLVASSKTILASLGLSDTVFGMTILALAVSIEELARELPAALQGRPEISFGNVVGSILAFFLCNAGIIAMVQPIPVSEQVLRFYLPLCLLTIIVVSLLMLRRQIPRWAGAVLVGLYLLFVTGGSIG